MGLGQRLTKRERGAAEGQNDFDLLKQVASGNQQAFEVLYRRFERGVSLYIAGLIGNQSDAEELTCETFFEVWRQAGTFRGASSVSTWIFGIARHKAFSLLRKRFQASEGEEVLEDTPAVNADPMEAFSKEEVAARVRKGLEFLSPEHREAIELSFYHGFSCQEIAEIVGCPVNTVKTRMFYARQHLKRILAGLRDNKKSA